MSNEMSQGEGIAEAGKHIGEGMGWIGFWIFLAFGSSAIWDWLPRMQVNL